MIKIWQLELIKVSKIVRIEVSKVKSEKVRSSMIDIIGVTTHHLNAIA